MKKGGHVQSASTLVESCFLCANGAMIALETTSSLLEVEDDVEVVSTGGGRSRFFSCALLEDAMIAVQEVSERAGARWAAEKGGLGWRTVSSVEVDARRFGRIQHAITWSPSGLPRCRRRDGRLLLLRSPPRARPVLHSAMLSSCRAAFASSARRPLPRINPRGTPFLRRQLNSDAARIDYETKYADKLRKRAEE